MPRGMTKAQCRMFERMAETEITKTLGPGAPYLDTGLEWQFPYGETGTVTIHLFRDSMDRGNVYRASWLACRWDDPNRVGPDGYTLPRNQVPGGWPSGYTYPSGKNNHHPGRDDDEQTMRRQLALFLYGLAPYGSKEREGFGSMEWEPA